MDTLQKNQNKVEQKSTQVNPSKIMEVGMAFMASKTLLAAIKLNLFTYLAQRERSGHEIQTELGIHDRAIYDFLDALVALGFLNRSGIKKTAKYSNTEDTDLFLDKDKPTYIGGILQMCNNRLYGYWDNLEEGLKTGLPQNELKTSGRDVFNELYSNENKLNEFVNAMGGAQMGNFIAFANKFDFSGYSTFCDIGGAGGFLAAQVVMNNNHMMCDSFDLPQVSALAATNIKQMGLANNVIIQSGDFFKDDFPKADVIAMGNILHDWGLKDKKILIKKAYNALPIGGSFVVIENIIDNKRSKNAFGLLMSLNMLIETPDGFDCTAADLSAWTKDVGFKESSVIPLTGPTSAFIAIK